MQLDAVTLYQKTFVSHNLTDPVKYCMQSKYSCYAWIAMERLQVCKDVWVRTRSLLEPIFSKDESNGE